MNLPSLLIQMACIGWSDSAPERDWYRGILSSVVFHPFRWDGWRDLFGSFDRDGVRQTDPCLSVHLKIGLILIDLSGDMQSGCYRIVSKRGADVSPPFPLRPI